MNINTNVQSLAAGNALKVNSRAMSGAMEQLSSGKRINSASNDAAGLAVTQSLTAQSRGLNMAVRNANDAISMAQTAEGALIEVSNMLQRMRELAVQASTGTISAAQRGYLAGEATALADQIDSTLNNTRWNGHSVLAESTMVNGIRIQVGSEGGKAMGPYNNVVQTFAGSNQVTIASLNCGLIVGDTVQISQQTIHDNVLLAGDYRVVAVAPDSSAFTVVAGTTAIAGGAAGGGTLNWRQTNSELILKGSSLVAAQKVNLLVGGTSDMSSAATSSAALAKIDTGLEAVNKARATLGASVNRLTSVVDNLTNVSQNLIESRSRILDTDYAAATTELARTQIIQQAGMAVLAQANQQPQSVLSLLRP